jgi:hypothetical protein
MDYVTDYEKLIKINNVPIDMNGPTLFPLFGRKTLAFRRSL